MNSKENFSNMTLSELLELRDKVSGTDKANYIIAIDNIIYKEYCPSKFYYDNLSRGYRREKKKNKTKKREIRKNCKEITYGGEERW